jgi:hypothetical protein
LSVIKKKKKILLENKVMKKVKEFINEIKIIQQQLKVENLEKFIKDSEDLIENNEFGIALENLLTNLYEFEFRLNQKQINIAKEAIKKMNWKWEDWKFIQELVKD